MAESDAGDVRTAAVEGEFFDSVIAEQRDFNPFSDRGWRTLREQFARRVARVAAGRLRLLEVGCGTGRSSQIYRGLIATHVGIDLSHEAVRVAAKRFPRSAWLRSNAAQLPFADESFDIVAFSSVLHHIKHYTSALKEAFRVLRPGGMIFAFDPNLMHPAMFLFRWPTSPFYISTGVSPNERPLLRNDLRRAFEETGFQNIHAWGQSDIEYRQVSPRFINALLSLYNAANWLLDRSGLAKWFGTFIVTTAQKPGKPGHMSSSPSPEISKKEFRYSVVVPVYNESESIREFCQKALQYLPPNYDLLICYDFAEDKTLPALAAMPAEAKPANIKLVLNTLGRGVRYAIEAGMRAATADVVVVMMADVSDDFPKVDEMVTLVENGADVVCASRYMRGGHQIGGPKLKGFLSRMAGLTLHWFGGLPTHDPTNSFKAYRKDFLDRTPIESTAGFCLGLELTAKAHFSDGIVKEVPATWLDRSAGESRFKLMKWLPLYLHWYFWALKKRWLGK